MPYDRSTVALTGTSPLGSFLALYNRHRHRESTASGREMECPRFTLSGGGLIVATAQQSIQNLKGHRHMPGVSEAARRTETLCSAPIRLRSLSAALATTDYSKALRGRRPRWPVWWRLIAKRRFHAFALPSLNDRYLRTADGRSRRIAAVADHDRERRKWAGKRALPLDARSARSGSS